MRDHTLEMSKFHHQALFVSKILRICTLSGWVLGNNLKAKLRHFSPLDNSFPGNREIQVLSLSSKYSQLIMNANKPFVFSHNRAFAASYSRGTKPLCWGVREGRSGTRQTNSSLH